METPRRRLACTISERSFTPCLVATQHTIDQVTQGTPEVFPCPFFQAVLIDEQDVVFEAGVEMRFQTQMHNDGVVMAVNVCVHPVKTLENLPDCLTKMLWKLNTYRLRVLAKGS